MRDKSAKGEAVKQNHLLRLQTRIARTENASKNHFWVVCVDSAIQIEHNRTFSRERTEGGHAQDATRSSGVKSKTQNTATTGKGKVFLEVKI